MRNLNIDKGIKEYSINGDTGKILRVNTSDIGIIARFEKTESELMKIADKYSSVEENITINTLTELDEEVKKQIDYIFGDGASNIIFGDTNCVSLAGGQPIFMNFLDAILPTIKSDIIDEQKKSKKKISKYTSQVGK